MGFQPIGRMVAVAVLGLSAVHAGAAVVHDESVDGDLSTDPNTPTALSLSLGSNIINGTVQSPNDTRDYVTFTIGAGQQLAAINQLEYIDGTTGGPGDRGFHAIIAGSTSFVPSGGTIGSFLGSAHLDPVTPGTDLLPTLGAASTGGIGFVAPLGPGTYTYHVQQTGTEFTRYSFELAVVPEPATAGLLFGLGGLAMFRRR